MSTTNFSENTNMRDRIRSHIGIGDTVLCYAVRQINGRPQIINSQFIEFLIKDGADVNETGQDGKPPLCFAYENLQLDIIKLLIENGACVENEVDRPGMIWESKGLLRNGSEIIGITDEEREFTQIYSVICNIIKDYESRRVIGGPSDKGPIYIELIKYLVRECGIDLNRGDVNSNLTEIPLFYAIKKGSYDMVQLLVELGADPNVIIGGNAVSLWGSGWKHRYEADSTVKAKLPFFLTPLFYAYGLNQFGLCVVLDNVRNSLSPIIKFLQKNGGKWDPYVVWEPKLNKYFSYEFQSTIKTYYYMTQIGNGIGNVNGINTQGKKWSIFIPPEIWTLIFDMLTHGQYINARFANNLCWSRWNM